MRVPRVVTRHWAIATNDHTAPKADVVATYNRRQGCDEQGTDKLKNDMLPSLPRPAQDQSPELGRDAVLLSQTEYGIIWT